MLKVENKDETNKQFNKKLYLSIILVIVALFFSFTWFWAAGYHLADVGNLLRETNRGTKNFVLLDNGYDAVMESDGKGIKVTMNSHDESGWLALFYNDGYSKDILTSPAGDEYSLSFKMKSNINHAVVHISHKEKNAKNDQINFGSSIIEDANRWVQITLKGSLTGMETTAQGLYIDLRSNPPGTEIYIKDLRLRHAG